MDIKHLKYFIAIVENNFNLSQTASLLYVAQPTLSIMINDFEKKEGINLFQRERGRIINLTNSGEDFYQDAKEVVAKYDGMRKNLQADKKSSSGSLTIGIPPLILSLVFATVLPKLILENPAIQFKIKEEGAYALQDSLLLDNVDFAVLLAPERISAKFLESHQLFQAELALFMSPAHPLASKKLIQWEDLGNQKIALFDETFMINHLVSQRLNNLSIYPEIVLTSASWDFLLNSTKINQELVSILPSTILDTYPNDEIICLPMAKPIPWIITLCRIKKQNYSQTETYFFNEILKAFT